MAKWILFIRRMLSVRQLGWTIPASICSSYLGVACLLAWISRSSVEAAAGSVGPPNIVWIQVDDMSPHFACYGETSVRTPNVDTLATSGIRFTRAFVTGPICSISRSALITGRYQTSIGAQNHRSGSARYPIRLSDGIRPVPQIIAEAGYHVSNVSLDDFLAVGGEVKVAKTDYNFVWEPSATYSRSHWSQRPSGQPFFVQIQLAGGKHRGQAPGVAWPKKVQAALGTTTSVDVVRLPPYLPRDPVLVADWAQYLDCVRYTDWEVGRIVQRLKQAGEWDKTVVIFWTDHGISHVRNKQFLYDGGIHVPMVMAGPGLRRGKVRSDLVEHIDIAATTIAMAGLQVPGWMHGLDLLRTSSTGRRFMYAARDRADETVDRIRSVRSKRYKYIRNYFPSRPYLQPNRYKDDKAILKAMRRLHQDSMLNPDQSRIMGGTRPREEFYDLRKDPWELRNLAEDPHWSRLVSQHRSALEEWSKRTGDAGDRLESDEVYLDYVHDGRPEGGGNQQNEIFDRNVELMRKWAVERPMEE